MKARIKQLLSGEKTGWFLLMDQAVVSGTNFLTGILLARSLGLAGYGEFALAWLVVLFCSSIHHSWLISPMYTFAPKQKEGQKKAYFNSLMVHQLFFAVGAGLLALGFVSLTRWFFPEWEIAQHGPWIALTVFTYLMYDFLRRLQYALGKAKRAFQMSLLVHMLQIMGLLVLQFNTGIDLRMAFVLFSISYTSAILIDLKPFTSFSWEFQAFVNTARMHWRYSKWLMATALLQWFSGNAFILVAGGILSPLAVGSIRILQNIVGVLHLLFLAMENHIPLKAAEIFQKSGRNALNEFMLKFTWKGCLVTLLGASLLAWFGKEIIQVVYGEEFSAYAYLLYGFAIHYVLVFIGTSFRFTLRTLEQTQSIFGAYVCSALFSLLFAKPILQNFGVEGILIGLISTQIIMQIYFAYSLNFKLFLPWKSST